MMITMKNDILQGIATKLISIVTKTAKMTMMMMRIRRNHDQENDEAENNLHQDQENITLTMKTTMMKMVDIKIVRITNIHVLIVLHYTIMMTMTNMMKIL